MRSPPTRLEFTALPDEWADLCRKLRPDLSPYKAWENFHRYWTGEFGEKGMMKDWRATWRNHIMNLKRYPLFRTDKRPNTQTYTVPPKRTYSDPKALPARDPSSPAYREFQQRLREFRQRAPQVNHPRFIAFGWVQVGDALGIEPEPTEAQREWDEERIAIEQEGKRHG